MGSLLPGASFHYKSNLFPCALPYARAGFREHVQTSRLDYHGGRRYPYLERDASKPGLLDEQQR